MWSGEMNREMETEKLCTASMVIKIDCSIFPSDDL